MGKFLRATKKDLARTVGDIEKDVRKVLINAVEVAVGVNADRVDTGFMISNWYFTRMIPKGEPLKNEGQVGGGKEALSLRNAIKWKFGENAFIVNNTEYASYHDLGTVYITPLFISFQVEHYIEKELRKIK